MSNQHKNIVIKFWIDYLSSNQFITLHNLNSKSSTRDMERNKEREGERGASVEKTERSSSPGLSLFLSCSSVC